MTILSVNGPYIYFLGSVLKIISTDFAERFRKYTRASFMEIEPVFPHKDVLCTHCFSLINIPGCQKSQDD